MGSQDMESKDSPIENLPRSQLIDILQRQYIQDTVTKEDESSATFVCNICKKTFYNEGALQNHKNLQHDVEGSGSEGERNFSYTNSSDQMLDGLCGFKFIPRSENDQCTIEKDGFITRRFSEDTSYLIVKVEGDGLDGSAAKRARLNGIVRRAQARPQKPPVDLRGPFTCTLPSTLRPDVQCRQIFFNCCEYSMHYREEHTKRRKAALRCQVCEKRLDRDSCLSNTLGAQLNVPHRLTFSCRTCGHTFLSSVEYDEHNRIVHAKMKPHQCSLCNKRFTQQGGLQQHMRMHTGIRPFACTYCPKAFTQKAGLDQHLRTHTKVKPFKCVICSKCFSQSVHLRQHMRTHTNIQPFECPVCARRFKQSSHLNFHMRSHMGESGVLIPEHYDQSAEHQSQLDFFNLANVKPVQHGEALYYAAELVSRQHQETYSYPSQVTNENILF